MSITTVRIEITREELIALAMSKAEERGIPIPNPVTLRAECPEVVSMEVRKPGCAVKPVWHEYSGGFEEQAEALANGCDLAWVEITIYPGKPD